MVAPLRRVAVRPPALSADYPLAHWAEPLDHALLQSQHEAFVGLLASLDCDVAVLDRCEGQADSCFTYDPAFVIPAGVVQLRAAKAVRADEGSALVADLNALGVPTVGELSGSATADGGDMFWLDDTTLAIGRTYRTNAEGVFQMSAILAETGLSAEVFDMPHDLGPEYCLHLMSVVSPVREDLAVVYEKLAPVSLLQALSARGISWVTVPDDEYVTIGCNVLAVRPGVVVMAEGNDKTADLLREQGVEVHFYAASEINKGEGGPTCLTRPIWRAY